MKTTYFNIESAVSRWCNGGFVLRSSFYTGRGVNSGDLNSEFLEMIYQGLKAEVGQEAATNFAKFVNWLEDLSASAFIQAFEEFWYNGCKDVNFRQRVGTGNQISGRGEEMYGEGFALIGAALGRSLMGPEETARASPAINRQFVLDHRKEIAE